MGYNTVVILILVSFENKEDAEKVANALVNKKLAACVSLFPTTNFYYWKGKKVKSSEIESIIKTKDDKFDAVKSEIEKLVSYEIPQIISVKVDKASQSYIKWLEEGTN